MIFSDETMWYKHIISIFFPLFHKRFEKLGLVLPN